MRTRARFLAALALVGACFPAETREGHEASPGEPGASLESVVPLADGATASGGMKVVTEVLKNDGGLPSIDIGYYWDAPYWKLDLYPVTIRTVDKQDSLIGQRVITVQNFNDEDYWGDPALEAARVRGDILAADSATRAEDVAFYRAMLRASDSVTVPPADTAKAREQRAFLIAILRGL